MTVNSVSSLAMRDAVRSTMVRTQTRLDETANEVASGRHYDVGRVLGMQSANAIDARQSIGDIDAIITSNGLASTKMAAVQGSLSAMTDIADSFFETMISAAQPGADRSLVVDDARNKLTMLMGLLSTTSNGAYVFGGLNSNEAPIINYLDEPPPQARSDVLAAFTSEFGFPPGDVQSAEITPGQIEGYLSGSFASFFESPTWQSAFSNAIDGTRQMRISPQEVSVETVNGNDVGIRRLVSALVTVIDTSTVNLNSETFQSLAASVAESASMAAGELAHSQASAGSIQERLVIANERMSIERGLLERTVSSLENVDLSEASARLNHLATQLEVSFAVTARLQRLTLLNYL